MLQPEQLQQQFPEKWRERLFYQYKLYVDNIARLHSKEHVSLTLYILLNGFLVFATLLSLGVEIFIKAHWLDLPFVIAGIVGSLGYILYSTYIHRRYKSMFETTKEMERSLPSSLILYASPTAMYMRALQYIMPWFFLGAYFYILLTIHIFPRTFI